MSIDESSLSTAAPATDVESVSASDLYATETKSAPEAKASDETAPESDTEEQVSETQGAESEGEANEEDDSDESQDDSKPKKKKNGFKKRINKLNQRLTEREREIEYWRAEALKQKPQGDVQSPEPKIASATTEGKPNPDDYSTHSDYVDALTDWKVDQKLKAKETEAKQNQAKAEFEKTVSTHTERVKTFAESHKDFHEVLEDVDDIPMSVAVQQVIVESENGPELMYELAKNRDELARICKLSPLAAARELGKFETRIKASSEKKTEIKKTKAPTPISPVGSKASAAVKSLEDMDYEEFRRARNEQLKNRRR